MVLYRLSLTPSYYIGVYQMTDNVSFESTSVEAWLTLVST
jgi:hypothetical protein